MQDVAMESLVEWFEEARRSSRFIELGFESVHISQLAPVFDPAHLREDSYRLFSHLVRIYREHAAEIKPMLVIVVGESEHMDLTVPTFARLDDYWDGQTPPEFYLLRREPDLSPYVVEEYKVPLRGQPLPNVEHGCCYAYYRCHRQDDQEEFTRALYFEHYPHAV